MSSRFEKFSEKARKVLSLAQEEAQRFNHNYIGTEHILLGLVKESDGAAARILISLSLELNKVRSAVEFIIGRGERRPTPGEIGLTPRAKKVIELAVDEARRLNQQFIGTEHLLIGIMREGEGVASGVLESLGINLDKIRSEATRISTQTGYTPTSSTSKTPSKTPTLDQLGIDCDITWRNAGNPFFTHKGTLSDALSKAINEHTGIEPDLSTSGGTSDGRFIAPHGIDVVEFGPLNKTIHKVNEEVSIGDIPTLEKIYYRTAELLLEKQK